MPRLHPGPGPGAAGGLATEATLQLVRDYLQYPNGRAGESYGAGALTNVWSTTLLTLNGADALSALVPDRCLLEAIDFAFDTILAGATQITCYVSEDAAGLYSLTYPATIAWVAAPGGLRFVGSYLIGRAYRRSAAAGAAGTLYLQAFLNAGTANVVARLRWLP
jgi:hypothetical protein